MTTYIIFGSVIALMIITGIFLLNGKGAFLIAGYNTMNKSEKVKYDEKAVCRFAGRLLIGLSVSFLLLPVGIYFETDWLMYIGIAFILAGTIGAAVYANTGNRFMKDGVAASAESKKTSKIIIIAVSVLSAIILIPMGVLLYQGGKDPGINIHADSIQIKSMYGLTVKFSDITEITLMEKSMNDIGPGSRINGYGGIGQALKGHFRSESTGETLLFVQSKSSPTIRIERSNGKDIYISFKDGEKTRRLYYDMTGGQ